MSRTHHPRPARVRKSPRRHASDVAFHAANAMRSATAILGQPGHADDVYDRASALRATLLQAREDALELRDLAARSQRSDAA